MGLHGDAWVHLYEFGIGGEPAGVDWDLLSAEEHSRAGFIRDRARRNRFVVRRAALHRIVSGYPADLCFSASDSGDVGVVAVAGRAVGVDVEVEAPRRAYERIARRMLAPDERSLLRAAGDDDSRSHLFHRCWVAKEAYAKGLGHGLAMRFDAFSVVPALRSPAGFGPVGSDWSVSVSTHGDTHLAVAAVGDDWEVTSGG